MPRPLLLPLVVLLITSQSIATAETPPVSTDPRVRIDLFAEDPLLATPTGIDIDGQGRVWAIESNTHFPPEGYTGHPTDRVLTFTDKDGDGRAEAPVVFADGIKHAMSIAVRPVWMNAIQLPGQSEATPETATQVFLATRRDLQLLEDINGDGQADRRHVLLQLDTTGDYPHNGLAGFAFDALDNVYIGLGENLGRDYTLIGRDGTKLSGGGEGGNVYRFRPDGSGLEFWSTGYWNPHASCVDAFGHLFTVDNDPDSRPPCRLMHSVRGGDFGYRFRNGRKGLHPFTAWNGEIPGTLPMLAGTGEAPSGLLAYESAGLPEEFVGDLIGGSWGDHRVDRFRLKQKGASYESVAEPLIVGDQNFRPVGIATAPDGSLYLSDWVLRDYKVHGRGRIWRISNVDAKAHHSIDFAAIKSLTDPAQLLQHIESPKLAERRVAARRLADLNIKPLIALARNEKAPVRPRYEAVTALIPHKGLDHERQLTQYGLATAAPYDAVQALYLEHYNQLPSIPRTMEILQSPTGNDPQYLIGSMRSLSPLIRSLGSSQPKAAVTLLGNVASLGDPFVFGELVQQLRSTLTTPQIEKTLSSKADLEPPLRLALVLAAVGRSEPFEQVASLGLADTDAQVRRVTVQAVAEKKLTALRPAVEAVLTSEPMNEELFLATLAAIEMLNGKSPIDFDKTPAAKYVIPILKSSLDKPGIAIQAIRLAQPKESPEVAALLAGVVAGAHPLELKREAIRSLTTSPTPEILAALQAVADDEQADLTLRQWAFLGLANQPAIETDWWVKHWSLGRKTLLASVILGGLKPRINEPGVTEKLDLGKLPPENSTLFEAVALALPTDSTQITDPMKQLLASRPKTTADWATFVEDSRVEDPAAVTRGQFVFSHPNGPGCIKCHRLEGRGGLIGPDLSHVGGTFSTEKIITSILEPSREISPQFTTWVMTTPEGQIHTGMLVFENEGKTFLGNAEGQTIELKTVDVETRTPSKTSVMPEKLVDKLTHQEWLDLIAFLRSRK